jgi:hypothetical protein
MRHVFAIVIIVTFYGCSRDPVDAPSDAEIRRNIVATWIVDDQLPRGGSVKGTVTINSDGKFVSEATFVLEQRSDHVSFEGKWQVKHGALIETVTESDSEIVQVGDVTSDKIIRVDENELVYQTESGESVVRKRSK